MLSGDTIAAISSAVGPAARMIVRASGPKVPQICAALLGTDPLAFSASQARLHFRGVAVPAWVYRFAAPRSVTGEDVVELHIPGNPLLARMLLDELIHQGARQAEAGEFTARAYFSGRLDLAEAEGVAATIAAQSERELAAARQLLSGELARRLRPVMDSIAQMLALIEVGIDFTEEDVTFLSDEQIHQRLDQADKALADLLAQSSRFERLSHEPQIVLVGRPNAGKSTLLNALAGHERAVVSHEAGTTRDAIWAHVRLPRGMVRLIDVAGIEPANPSDHISRQMQERALHAIAQADAVLLVQDSTDSADPLPLPRPADLRIATKRDLGPAQVPADVQISAKTGENMDHLIAQLDRIAFGPTVATGAALALNARHVQAVNEARDALARCREQLLAGVGHEVLAMELRETLDCLGAILGSVTPDDVLGKIFAGFCIGK
jgi:tRNA modification GTPase